MQWFDEKLNFQTHECDVLTQLDYPHKVFLLAQFPQIFGFNES